MAKFIAKKRLYSNSLITSYSNEYEEVPSFNENSLKLIENNDIKYLIVGTLTPPEGRENKYFYTSSKNKMFEYIDIAFSDNNFSLTNLKNSKKIEDIEKILIERKIAFLDVIEKAIASKTSSSDDDIISYVLDYKAFEEIKKYPNIKIAVNSKNAQVAFEVIREKLEMTNDFELIPQSLRGYHHFYKNKPELINRWKMFFDKTK